MKVTENLLAELREDNLLLTFQKIMSFEKVQRLIVGSSESKWRYISICIDYRDEDIVSLHMKVWEVHQRTA